MQQQYASMQQQFAGGGEMDIERAVLRDRRKRLGISLDEMGSAIGGIDSGSLSRFERGYRDLPKGRTHEDYERALEQLERERVAS